MSVDKMYRITHFKLEGIQEREKKKKSRREVSDRRSVLKETETWILRSLKSSSLVISSMLFG